MRDGYPPQLGKPERAMRAPTLYRWAILALAGVGSFIEKRTGRGRRRAAAPFYIRGARRPVGTAGPHVLAL